MRKYKFVLLVTVVVAVFFTLSWFVYDGIDIFFEIVYKPTDTKMEAPQTTVTKSKQRTDYKTKDANPEKEKRDDTAAPDTRYIKAKKAVYRESAFEKFLIKIFPEQLDYVLNPYNFFLLLVLSVLPIIGIFIFLLISFLR